MPTDKARHVHIGAGSLGLGLVCWVTSRAGYQVILANRLHDDRQNHPAHAIQRHSSYTIVERNGAERGVKIERFVPFDGAFGWHELRGAICAPDVELITTALKGGLEKNVAELASALAERVRLHPARQVRVIACENSHNSDWLQRRVLDHLRRRRGFDDLGFLAGVTFADCVVDRMCKPVELRAGEAIVRTEDYARWVVKKSPMTDAGLGDDRLKGKALSDAVLMVDDVHPYALRKKLLINGPHLMLALLTRAANLPSIKLYAGRKSGLRYFNDVMSEGRDMLLRLAPNFTAAEIDAEVELAKKRLLADDRLARTILSRFREPTIVDFFADYSSKLSDSVCKTIDKTKVAPPMTARCLFVAADLVEQRKWFREQEKEGAKA